MNATTYKATLGIYGDTSAEEIKRRYCSLIREHHPDKGGSVVRAQEINLARDYLLSHPECWTAPKPQPSPTYTPTPAPKEEEERESVGIGWSVLGLLWLLVKGLIAFYLIYFAISLVYAVIVVVAGLF